MTGFSQSATDKNLRAWLNAGPVDRGVGDGLTFVAKEASAREGKASWILRYRYGGRQRERSSAAIQTSRSKTREISPARIERSFNRKPD